MTQLGLAKFVVVLEQSTGPKPRLNNLNLAVLVLILIFHGSYSELLNAKFIFKASVKFISKLAESLFHDSLPLRLPLFQLHLLL